MAKGPEPRDSNTGCTPSPSVKDQLIVFREQLDRSTYEKEFVTKVVPGFLFRDGEERRARIQRSRLENDILFDYWRSIDENLVAQHIETHRRGIEARDQLLGKIKPAEILMAVRDVWGKGEIAEKEGEATLTYSYASSEEECGTGSHTFPAGMWSVGNPNPEPLSIGYSYKTGRWFVWGLEVRETVGIGFGYARAPIIEECFADNPKGEPFWVVSHLEEHFEVPKTIWQRPDNLGIYATIPYMLRKLTPSRGSLYGSFERVEAVTWFDPTTQPQIIMDYLSQKLEEQRRAGQLPSQVELLELAKIEELSRRGILNKWAPISPTYVLS